MSKKTNLISFSFLLTQFFALSMSAQEAEKKPATDEFVAKMISEIKTSKVAKEYLEEKTFTKKQLFKVIEAADKAWDKVWADYEKANARMKLTEDERQELWALEHKISYNRERALHYLSKFKDLTKEEVTFIVESANGRDDIIIATFRENPELQKQAFDFLGADSIELNYIFKRLAVLDSTFEPPAKANFPRYQAYKAAIQKGDEKTMGELRTEIYRLMGQLQTELDLMAKEDRRWGSGNLTAKKEAEDTTSATPTGENEDKLKDIQKK